MNYAKHYNRLVERAITRKLDTYTENHHVIPRCLGGVDTKDNLVALTPEEHYVAHQLLVKMHPEEPGLVYAALMMCTKNKKHCRNNKRYGWLKRKYSKTCKKRVGSKNNSYGRRWYHNPNTLQNGKFLIEDIPCGWVLGRVPYSKCDICGTNTGTFHRKYCVEHRRNKGKSKPGSKEKYQRLWDLYQKSEYKTASAFADSDLCDVTDQALTYGWRKHINGFELQQGKSRK